jgi:charged multivesicular body protein 2A
MPLTVCVDWAEQLREYKRMIDKSVRDLERERTQLQRQEQKILVEIKKSAKANQMVTKPWADAARHLLWADRRAWQGAVKIMAKDLVRTRNSINKFYEMKTQLQAVGLRLQAIAP